MTAFFGRIAGRAASRFVVGARENLNQRLICELPRYFTGAPYLFVEPVLFHLLNQY
jgi:hypothetical protein